VAKKKGGRSKKVVARKASKRKTAARAAARRSRARKPAATPSRLSSAVTLVRGAAAGAAVAIARRLPWARDEDDPIVLLESDHRRFEALLKQGEATTERGVKSRTHLLETLTAELNVHELIEEKILYPALEPHAQAREIVLEGYQEHHVADLILKELHTLARDDEQWGAKFKVLKENIEHHLEEEEREMFRIARAVLSRDDLNDLGMRMKSLKSELEA
jgi:Hemerythrin HHE cation binding domain